MRNDYFPERVKFAIDQAFFCKMLTKIGDYLEFIMSGDYDHEIATQKSQTIATQLQHITIATQKSQSILQIYEANLVINEMFLYDHFQLNGERLVDVFSYY